MTDLPRAALIRVTGRVQGVGYRFFVEEAARRTGLNGYVKNLPDRSVEMLVEGPQQVIEPFVDLLRIGPPAARVEHVAVEMVAAGGVKGFSIRY